MTSRPQGPAANPSIWSRPPHASSLAEWALLPLRAFIGFTFLYAGLQKLCNPNFFNAASPISIQNQLAASARVSPIGGLLVHLQGVAVLIGVLMALGELAVAVGTLLGLFTRVAATGGLLISLMLFLTVSFHSSPYFTGADIVYFFAWIPLIVAGGGSRLSLDGLIARTAARQRRHPDPEIVAIPFVRVREHCGHYEAGRCRARGGAICEAPGCPVLATPGGSVAEVADALDRRELIRRASLTGAVAGVAAVFGGVVVGSARALARATVPPPVKVVNPTTTTSTSVPKSTTTTSTSVPGSTTSTVTTTTEPSGLYVGAAKSVGVGSYEIFNDTENGQPGIVVCPKAGEYVAYNAVCPHMGCTVGYSGALGLIVCPCHGSEFNVETGQVVQGPAPHGLTKYTVVEGPDGDLYIS